jgi:hypothetical protein
LRRGAAGFAFAAPRRPVLFLAGDLALGRPLATALSRNAWIRVTVASLGAVVGFGIGFPATLSLTSSVSAPS